MIEFSTDAVLLISGSIALIAILASFTLNVGFTLIEKRRSMNFEMGIQYYDFMKVRRKIDNKLLVKIKKFEEEVMIEYFYSGGKEYNQHIEYSTEINYKDVKQHLNNKILKKILKNKGFVYSSLNFSKFQVNSCVSFSKTDEKLARKIYDSMKLHANIEDYLIYVDLKKNKVFDKNELDTYNLFIKDTKLMREKIWNLALTRPGMRQSTLIYLTLLYAVGIAFVGIVYPMYSPINIKENLLWVVGVTLIYVLLFPLNFLTIRHRKKLDSELNRFYYL